MVFILGINLVERERDEQFIHLKSQRCETLNF